MYDVCVSLGVYFTVGLSQTTFMEGEIIKFDRVITNVGGGYIDDDSNADCGKFIAPQNGTYQFNVNVYNDNERIGADLLWNSELVLGTKNGNGAGSQSAILDLKENDQVYLQRPQWVSDTTTYIKHFINFSGFLMRAEV